MQKVLNESSYASKPTQSLSTTMTNNTNELVNLNTDSYHNHYPSLTGAQQANSKYNMNTEQSNSAGMPPPQAPPNNTVNSSPYLSALTSQPRVQPTYRPAFHGKKAPTNCKIKGVAPKINLMISRLNIDTTEEELLDHLTEMGIEGATCKKLKGVDTRTNYTYKTAAFFVSVTPLYHDTAFNMDNWPEECVIREWFVKPRSS